MENLELELEKNRQTDIVEPYKLPDGWKWCKQSEVCKLVDSEKIADKELSVADIEEIADNIRAKAKVLFNRIGDEWGRSDDGCHDIATAAVAFGKQNYEKCLKDYDYLVSMGEATKEYENVLYPFNDVVEENKK